MAEQIFKAPGFFDREIDLTAETLKPAGIPAGVIGTAQKGPAFVPTTVGSFPDFITKFGSLDPRMPAPYGANLFLKNRYALTFLRTLGAGANETVTDIEATRTKGIVVNAGFQLSGTLVGNDDNRSMHSVQFLTARHTVTGSEVAGNPMFSDNSSFFTTGSATEVYLVRGVLFSASDARVMLLNTTETFADGIDDLATPDANLKFKVAISSSAGATFATTDGSAGVRIVTCSLSPTSDDYFAKVLNTDPLKFGTEKHLVYLNFAVDQEIATLTTGANTVCIASGSDNTSDNSGDASLVFRNAFGRFDTRFTTPSTPSIISQPFGLVEYDLFSVESLDDGAYANNKIKVSIANVRASTDPRNPYGTFAVLVRNLHDDDTNPEILEQFNECTLNPASEKYVARMIGDTKVYFNFDAEAEEDRRLVRSGKYPAKSNYVRVVMSSNVEDKAIPAKSLPFGFRGVSTLNTNPLLTDATSSIETLTRLGASGALGSSQNRLLHAVVPPLPLRFKVTRGAVNATVGPVGTPGSTELTDSRFYWGLKTSRNTDILNPNPNGEFNEIINAYAAFGGIKKLDVLVTGSRADLFNDNKFTLARVALGNSAIADLTASVDTHMKEAAYLRNGVPGASDYTINDTYLSRITFASLVQGTSVATFNRFSEYAKFTVPIYGGWDGLNFLDKEQAHMTDKGTSAETGGGSNGSFLSPGFGTNQAGTSRRNNAIASYRVAANLMTDPFVVNVNLLAVPGQREPLVTDYVGDRAMDYKLAQYVMDVPYYDSNSTRIFDGSTTTGYVSVLKTADQFESRAVDNEFCAAYFPNIIVEDGSNNKRRVTLPASVGALAALGFNDKVAYPWFAPAGFNRAALDFVKLSQVKINQPERERLYTVRINPIIKLPGESFVIFSQQTLEQAGTALQSINVNRMVMSLKQQIIAVGNSMIFDQITPATQQRFVDLVKPILATVQVRDGIERFEIICDGRNNTKQDVQSNRMNAQIRVIPVRAAEFIALDFIVMNSGIIAV